MVDFGVLSQTNFIPVMVPSANTMLTSGGAAVIIQANVTQSSQLPATVPVDSGHTNNGWQFLEKPAFNLFNQWMGTVGLWVQYFWANMVTGIPAWNSAITYALNNFVSYNGQIYVSLTNSNLNNTPSAISTNWQLASSGGGKGDNVIRNGSMMISQRGQSGNITTGTSAYTLDGWIVASTGATTAWSQFNSSQGYSLGLTPGGTLSVLTLSQRIESTASISLGQNNITIQATFYNDTAVAITPQLSIQVPSSSVNNFGSLTTILAATNLQTVPANTTAVIAYTFTLTNSYTFNYGMQINFLLGSQVPSGSLVGITKVDVSTTPFVSAGLNNNPPLPGVGNVASELVKCQRFLMAWKFNNNEGAQIFIGTTISNHQAYIYFNFLVEMISIPSFSSSGSSWQVNCVGNSTDASVTGFTLVAATPYSALLNATCSGTSLTANVPCNLALVDNNADNFYFSAEL